MGSKPWGLNILKEIYSLSPETITGVLTIDDSNDARSVLGAFREFSEKFGLKIFVVQNKTQAERVIEELKPDLCFVAGWYWLISPSLLSALPYGFIGIHPSLLPRYRGGAPLVWAMINGERKAGFSLFSLSAGIDDGPVWAQGCIDIQDADDIADVQQKLDSKIAEVLRKEYLKILDGSIGPVEQDHSIATYCALRYPADGLIEWHKSAREIYNFIRAQSHPYPGAFTNYQGKLLTIWKARIFESPYFGTPGQVARITHEGVYIICGDHNAIIAEDVELDEKRGKAVDFIKSIKGRMSESCGKAGADFRQ